MSEFLENINQILALVRAIVTAVFNCGGNDSDLERVVEDKDLAARIADLIVGAKKKAVDTFRAMCDYATPSYTELRSAFDWVNGWYDSVEFKAIGICQSVSREPRVVEFVYVYMDRDASTDEIFAEMEKRNLRPALYEEGLGFAKAHPDEQRKFYIVMLGSVCVDPSGCRRVAVLSGDRGGRGIGLFTVGGGWSVLYRFLAVRK